MPFIEALRQLSFSLGIAGVLHNHFSFHIYGVKTLYNSSKTCVPIIYLTFFLEAKTSFFFSGYHECDPYTFIYFLGKENFCLIHVSLVPVLGVVGEQVNNSSFNGNDEFCLLHLLFVHKGKTHCTFQVFYRDK